MPDIIYRGLGARNAGLMDFLRNTFALHSEMSDDGLRITQQDAARVFPLRRVIDRHEQIELSPAWDAENAERLAGRITVADTPMDWGDIRIPDHLGRFTDLLETLTRVVTSRSAELPDVIRHRLLPLMRNLGATHVTAVTIDAERAQTILSLVRILCLTQHVGFEEAVRRIRAGHDNREIDPMGGVLPSPFDFVGFVDPFTRFPPVVMTLGVWRLNCAWHFQSPAMWSFHRGICNGPLNEFGVQPDPLSAHPNAFGLAGLDGMDQANVWRFLNLVTTGIDRLFGWLADPRNFQGQDGVVDLMRQAQAYSAVHLLFADLGGAHFVTNAHNRISYSMSALDKLANLRAKLGRVDRDEGETFSRLCSRDQGENAGNMIAAACQRLNYDDLGQRLSACVSTVFENLHTELQRQGIQQATEPARLERIRQLRNIRHGTFLRRNQFENLFLEASGAVPAALTAIPHLLALALISDVSGFLLYDPHVQDA